MSKAFFVNKMAADAMELEEESVWELRNTYTHIFRFYCW